MNSSSMRVLVLGLMGGRSIFIMRFWLIVYFVLGLALLIPHTFAASHEEPKDFFESNMPSKEANEINVAVMGKPDNPVRADEFAYDYLGQIKNIDYILQPLNAWDFIPKLRTITSDGRRIKNLIIYGHGDPTFPGIQISNPNDVVALEQVDFTSVAEQAKMAMRDREKAKKMLCEAQSRPPSVERYDQEKHAQDWINTSNSKLKATYELLYTMDSVSGIMADGGLIILMNCFSAQDSVHRNMSQKLGRLFFGNKSGKLIASTSTQAMWFNLLKNKYVDRGEGLWGKWVFFHFDAGESQRPKMEFLEMEFKEPCLRVEEGDPLEIKAPQVVGKADRGKLHFMWQVAPKEESGQLESKDSQGWECLGAEGPRCSPDTKGKAGQLLLVRLRVADEQGRLGEDALFLQVKEKEVMYEASIGLSEENPMAEDSIGARAFLTKGRAPEGSYWNWEMKGGLEKIARPSNDEIKMKVRDKGELTAQLVEIGLLGKLKVLAEAKVTITPQKPDDKEQDDKKKEAEGERIGREKAEKEKFEKERSEQAERERQESERLEKERAREQAEKDRIEAEQTAAWEQKILEEQKLKVPPTCTYQYSEWGECSRATRKQTRSVTGRKPEGCVEKGKPELEQECTPPPTAKELKEQLMGCLCRASGGYRYTPDECATGRPGDGVCSYSGPLGGFWCHHMKPNPAEKAAECYEIVYGKKANSAELSQLEKDIRDADKKNIKPLKVTLAPDAKPIKAQYGATVSLTANAEGGLPGYTYSWSGQGSPKDNTFSFINTRKPGTYAVSVTVNDSDGGSATAATSVVVEAITVTIEKTSPAGNTVPVGGQASFKATVAGAANVNYLWQPHPEVEFNPFEKSATTTATFSNPGSVGVWVDVLVKDGAVMRSVGQSNVITLQIANPQWALEFSPANPLVGQPVKAKISLTGPVGSATNTAEMNFRWQLPVNANQTGTSQDDREITFILKNTKPANISCTAATKQKNENLGGAGKTITAQGFEVKISGPRGRQEFQIWKCETQLGGAPACGMKKVENQFAAGNEILFGATVEPTPEKTVSYNWTVSPSGCSIASPFSREIGMTCSSTGNFNVKLIAKSDGMEIGSSSASVNVSISQNDINRSNKAKEAYEKLQKAKELVSQGKLNEGIALIDEALKLDPKHAEATALGPKLKAEKQTVMKHVESIKKLLPADNIAQAEKELAAAQKLHPKYAPVVEVEKSLNEAKKKIAEKKIKEEEANKKEQEGKDKQAQQLTDEGYGLEKKGDLAGAIKKYKEAVKIVPDKGTSEHIAELQKKIKDQKEEEEKARKEEALKTEQGRKDKQAQKLADEGYSLEKQGDLAGAIKKYQAAVKIVPDKGTSEHIAELQNNLKKQKDEDKKEADLKTKQSSKDKQAQKLADEGYGLEKKGDLAGAIKKYKEAVKIVPDESTSEHIADLQKKIKDEEANKNDNTRQKQTTGYWRLTGTDGDTVFANPGPEWSSKEDFSAPDSATYYNYLKGELIHQSNFTWTQLPEKVYPGQVFPLTAQGKVVFHKDPWFVSGGLLVQFYGAMYPLYWMVGDSPRPDTGVSNKVTLDAKVPIGDPDKSKEKHYLRLRFSTTGTANTNPFTYVYEWIPDASVTNSGSMTANKPGKESVIFFNGNDSGVSPGGKSPRFNIDRPVRVTFLFTYHNGYTGEPGTIRVVSATGAVIGTWKARGRAGSPQSSWYWEITPDVKLQPGSYRIETSNPGSWSQNSGSGGNGMVQIKGVYLNP